MTAEELKVIQDWYQQRSGPYNESQLEKDVRALLGEARRLRAQNQTLRDALLAVVAAEDTKARSIQAIETLLATMP